MHIWEQRSRSAKHVLSDGPLQWLNESLSGYYSRFVSKPGNIPHIPLIRIGILVTALRANQPVYASLSVDPRLFVRAGPKMVRTGTVGRQRASNPQTIGKASVKQTKQSEEGPQTNKYFHLWWVERQNKGRAKERREEVPSSSFITSKEKKTYISGLRRRFEEGKSSDWTNAAASPGLGWPCCLFPVCGLLNGPNYHRYELQLGGRFCRRLQLPPGIAREMLFSAKYVINKTAGRICWRLVDFLWASDRKRVDLNEARGCFKDDLWGLHFLLSTYFVSLYSQGLCCKPGAGRISILI